MKSEMLTRTVRRFLQKPRIARLATIGADGYPHIVTIYFMLDGDDIILGSDRDERKVRNALANPKGAVIIGGDPATDEAGYMFQGDLSIEEDAGHAVMRKAGHDLAVYDVVDAPVRELEKVGAKVAHSSKEVAEKSDLIITMLKRSSANQSTSYVNCYRSPAY